MISNAFSEIFVDFGNSTLLHLPYLPLTKEIQSQIAFIFCSAVIAFIVAFTLDLFFSSLFNIGSGKTKFFYSPAKITTAPSTKKVLAYRHHKKSSSKSTKKAGNRGMS